MRIKPRMITVKPGGYLVERKWRNRDVTAGESRVGEEGREEEGKLERKRRYRTERRAWDRKRGERVREMQEGWRSR